MWIKEYKSLSRVYIRLSKEIWLVLELSDDEGLFVYFDGKY